MDLKYRDSFELVDRLRYLAWRLKIWSGGLRGLRRQIVRPNNDIPEKPDSRSQAVPGASGEKARATNTG